MEQTIHSRSALQKSELVPETRWKQNVLINNEMAYLKVHERHEIILAKVTSESVKRKLIVIMLSAGDRRLRSGDA